MSMDSAAISEQQKLGEKPLTAGNIITYLPAALKTLL